MESFHIYVYDSSSLISFIMLSSKKYQHLFFLKPESIQLAMTLLDEAEIVPGSCVKVEEVFFLISPHNLIFRK